jgi:sec-independent protein translocase protein TatA
MGISLSELLILLVIVIVLFGTKRLRDVGSDLGSAIKSFRKAIKDNDETESSSGAAHHTIEGEVVSRNHEKN